MNDASQRIDTMKEASMAAIYAVLISLTTLCVAPNARHVTIRSLVAVNRATVRISVATYYNYGTTVRVRSFPSPPE